MENLAYLIKVANHKLADNVYEYTRTQVDFLNWLEGKYIPEVEEQIKEELEKEEIEKESKKKGFPGGIYNTDSLEEVKQKIAHLQKLAYGKVL